MYTYTVCMVWRGNYNIWGGGGQQYISKYYRSDEYFYYEYQSLLFCVPDIAECLNMYCTSDNSIDQLADTNIC